MKSFSKIVEEGKAERQALSKRCESLEKIVKGFLADKKHTEFSHVLIKDEKRCPVCKLRKKAQIALT